MTSRPQPYKAKKRFGQHFLKDAAIVQHILDAVDPQPTDVVVEIGPGQGALTAPLVKFGNPVHAIELDRTLAARLRTQYRGLAHVTVHAEDALRFDFSSLAKDTGKPLRLVGNLPYNISTPLLFHVLSHSGVVTDMHFMLQKEVVERLAAAPGGGDFGRLSVMVQWRCVVESLFEVPPEAFDPPPRVDSAVVKLVPRPSPLQHVDDPAMLGVVVQALFAKRRKTIRNGLRHLMPPEEIESAGVDPSLRPEVLEVTAFCRLANVLGAFLAKKDSELGKPNRNEIEPPCG